MYYKSAMKRRICVAALRALALASWLPSLVQAQIGITVCACQPSVYTFQLDFNAVCDVGTIDSRPGIRGADCFARGIGVFADDIVDFVPVQVTSISIIEVDRQFQVLAQSPYSSNFNDGDKITYTSILGTPEGISSLDLENIPAGMQVDIVGINALEQPITNVWIILFDNVCGIFPVLEKGDKIGWTIIDDIRLPFQSVCPISGSVAPTPKPATFSPSGQPSKIPISNAPVSSLPALEEPTAHPSEAPSAEDAPVCIPGKGKAGKSGSGKSGKSGRSSGKGSDAVSGDVGPGSGKAGSGKAGPGKAGGSGNTRKLATHDDKPREPSSDAATTIRDFYRFGVTALSAGSRPVDPDYDFESDSRDFGKGKGSFSMKLDADDDDEYEDECLPPKKMKIREDSSKKKLTKIGKGKGTGNSGKAGKGNTGLDDEVSSSKGKGGKGEGASYNAAHGKGRKGGKAGSKPLAKKLEVHNPSRSKKLSKGSGDSDDLTGVGEASSGKGKGGKAKGKSGKGEAKSDNSANGKGGKGGKAGSNPLEKKLEVHSPSRSQKLSKGSVTENDDDASIDVWSGKGKSGNGISGKGKGRSDNLPDDMRGKGGKGGKAESNRLTKKLEVQNPSRSEKLLKDHSRSDKLTEDNPVAQKESKPVVAQEPTARPVAVDTSSSTKSPATLSPIKSRIDSSPAPSLTVGTLNMDLLQSRISHWFNQHADPKTEDNIDRRSLRQS